MKKLAALTIGLTLLFATKLYSQVIFSESQVLDEYGNVGGYHSNTPVYVIDLNNDGFEDVLILKGLEIQVRLNNNGENLEDEITIYENGNLIDGISSFVDLNQDGYLDCAITSDSFISILYGTGESFTVDFTMINNNTFRGQIDLLDYNRDGNADIVLLGKRSIYVNSHWQEGSTTFETVYSVDNPDTEEIYSFDLFDIDGSEKWGMILQVSCENRIYVSESDGFKLSKEIGETCNQTYWDIDDVDEDGKMDIILFVANSPIHLLRYDNNTNEYVDSIEKQNNIFPFINGVSFTDLNNDDHVDIAFFYAYGIEYEIGNGDGTFQSPIVLTNVKGPLSSHKVEIFDFDQNGYNDFIACGFKKYDLLLLDNFQLKDQLQEWYLPDFYDIKCSDLDVDNHKDIIAFNNSGDVVILWGEENGSYQEKSYIKVPRGVENGAILDINQDGIPDIICVQRIDYDNDVLLLIEGEGSRSFKDYIAWKYVPGRSPIWTIDSDKNGIDEVMLFKSNGSNLTLLQMDNPNYYEYNLRLGSKITINGSFIYQIDTLDFNLDSYTDIVTANYVSKNISILKNNKTGNFIEYNLNPGGSPHGIAAYDYNDDGWNDLLISVENDNGDYSLKVFINSTQGDFVYLTEYPLSNIYSPRLIRKVDIDGDEDNDIVISSWDNQLNEFFQKVKGLDTLMHLGQGIIPSETQGSRCFSDIDNDRKPEVIDGIFHPGSIIITHNQSVGRPDIITTTMSLDTVTYQMARIIMNDIVPNGRLVVLKEGNDINFIPVDDNFYSYSFEYGNGEKVDDKTYIIYSGNDLRFEVSQLKSNTNYELKVYEFFTNKPSGSIINFSSESVASTFTTKRAIFFIQDFSDTIKINEDTELILDLAEYINDFGENTYKLTNQNTEVTVSLSGTSLTVTPNKDYYGMDSISVVASLPTESLQIGFYLEILSVNDPPVIEDIDPVIINTDAPGKTEIVTVSYEDPDTEAENLRIEVTSSNQDVVSDDGIHVSINDGELLIEYNSKGYGISVITVKITDENGDETIMTFNLEVSEITGLEDIMATQLLYPNPTNGMVYLSKSLSDNNNESAVLYNTLGEIVMRNIQLSKGEVDLSTCSKGTYILKGPKVIFKIIKQ